MLKTTRLSNKLVPGKNNGSSLASIKNDNDGKVNRFGGNNMEYAKKSRN